MVKKEYQIIAKNFELAGRASSEIKRILKTKSISKTLLKRICAASYEAEINVVIHSVGGYMTFDFYDDDYAEINVYDDGPGILDVNLAMTEGYSTATEIDHINGFGAGMGLANIKKMSDVLEIHSDPLGTHLRILFFMGDIDA
jgi:serine/threonine-protein kinase RsbT